MLPLAHQPPRTSVPVESESQGSTPRLRTPAEAGRARRPPQDQRPWPRQSSGSDPFARAVGREGMTVSKNLYVGNLSFQTTADDLRTAFAAFGTVTSAQVVTDRETGRSRGFGFVEMADGGEAATPGPNGTQRGGR